MNERAKKIFMCLGSFFVGIFTFICGTILQSKRDTTNENRARAEELKRESDNQQSENRRVIESAREQQSNNREAITRIDEASEIIREIRAKQQILEDDSSLDEWYCTELFSDDNNSNDR